MYITKAWEKCRSYLEENLYMDILPEVYYQTIRQNIDILYHSEQLDRDTVEQLLEGCEFAIEQARVSGGDNSELLEEYRILLLAYQLYRLDKGAKGMANYVLMVRLVELLQSDIFFYEHFMHMLYLLNDLVPDFSDILYDVYWECSNEFADHCIMLLICRQNIIKGDFQGAYREYLTVWTELLSREFYSFEENDTIRLNYVYWLRVLFDDVVTVARMANKLQELQNFLEEQFNLTDCLLMEAEKDYFRMTLRCEICMEQDGEELENRVKEVQKWFDESQQLEKKPDPRLYLNFLVRVIRDSFSDRSYLSEMLPEYINICVGNDKMPDDYLLQAIFRGFSICGYEKIVDIVENFKDYLHGRIIFSNQYGIKNMNIRPLIWWAADDGHRGAVQYMLVRLSELYNSVFDLEKYIQVKKGCQEDFAYYTTMQTFSYLLSDEPVGKGEKYRLSVMNVDYMNDPNEGRVLQEFLRTHMQSDSQLFYHFTGQSEQRTRARADDTLVFLKSFSDKVDRLTMWSEYGDKGSGVCVVMDGATFQNAHDKQRLLESLHFKEIGNERDDYELYKVIYWDKNQDEFIAKGLDSNILKLRIEEIEQLLEQIFAELESGRFSEREQKLCMDFLQELFAKIKYLFKFEEYRDENETRVILQRRTVSSFQDIEEAGGEDPLRKKLFIHYPVKSIIKEIILGPKNQQSDEYIPYLVKKMAEINEGSQYSTVISKSSIDYR